jgi:hypothetical protein
VLSAIPDTAVANAKASDYDGSKWVANIGPDLPDGNGDPATNSVTIGGESFTAVRYDGSNEEFSHSNDSGFALNGDPLAIIITLIDNTPDKSEFQYYIDGGSSDEFVAGKNDQAGSPLRLVSGDISTSGDDADSNAHTFCVETDGSDARLLRDGTAVLSGTGTPDDLTGFTINGRGDDGGLGDSNVTYTDLDALEYTILENHSQKERDNEINRQMSKYNI